MDETTNQNPLLAPTVPTADQLSDSAMSASGNAAEVGSPDGKERRIGERRVQTDPAVIAAWENLQAVEDRKSSFTGNRETFHLNDLDRDKEAVKSAREHYEDVKRRVADELSRPALPPIAEPVAQVTESATPLTLPEVQQSPEQQIAAATRVVVERMQATESLKQQVIAAEAAENDAFVALRSVIRGAYGLEQSSDAEVHRYATETLQDYNATPSTEQL